MAILKTRNKTQLFILTLILLAAFFIRFWQIDKVPPSLYIDEADYGLQARSLIQTGKDYKGSLLPFWVHSFNDVRTPIPAYFTVISTLIFNTPELEIRTPAVFLGTFVVLVAFLLTKLWTKNFLAAVFVAAVFAVNPWQTQFSRFLHEGIFMMTFYLLGIYFFFKSLQQKSFKLLLISTIILSATVYTYRTMSLFVPLTLVTLFLLFARELLTFSIKKLVIVVSLAALIILPFILATTVGAPDQPRIAQLSIFSDPEVPIFVQLERSVDTGVFTDQTIVKPPTLSSFFFHNKLLSWFNLFRDNYIKTFSVDFLFLTGDENQRHSPQKVGQFYLISALALIFGIIFISRNLRKKEFIWLILWVLIAPIPSSLTVDGAHHGARLFNFSAPFLIIIGLGWWYFFENVKKIKFGKEIILPIVGLIWLFFFITYLHRYFVHFPAEAASSFGYGFKQAVLKISQVEKDYDRIAMVSTKGPPEIYFLYWSKTNPKLIQEYGTSFSQSINKSHPLDKYKVVDWPSGIGQDPEVARYLRPGTLYLVTRNEFPPDLRRNKPPEGVKVIDVISYPDREVVFYLITRNPNYVQPTTKPKFEDIEFI